MSIYRAYDIRGIFKKDLTVDIAGDIGKAFGTYLKEGTIAVGMDNRLSSPVLSEALINGLTYTGLNVVDLRTVPTPLLYFSIFHYNYDGGIMITGSHNPPEYNGFKLCKGKSTLYGLEIQEIKGLVKKGEFNKGDGELTKQDVIGPYIEYVKERITLKKGLTVAIDAGNGTASLVAPKLFKELDCEVIPLYCELDGNFPNHHPDPTVDEYLKDLITTVKREKADIGFAYDGDADRVGFVDDTGNIIRGDQALILFSRDILKRKKKAKIIFEVKCSQATYEEIEKHGGIPIMYRTGHSFIKKKMREENALLAGEMSGHFFFADNYYGYDDGIFASVRMAQLLSRTEKNLSALIRELPEYHSTPEIRVQCPDDEKFKIVEEITSRFQKKDYDVITIDGARIQFEDGWGLVRASNTQPALILRFEAKTQKKLEEIQSLIKNELRNLSVRLE